MSLRSLLNQTITVKNPSTARDAQGNLALGTAFTVKARFERTNTTIVTAQNERTPIHGIVFVGIDDTVADGAQITYSGELYRVMTRDDIVLGSGSLHHRELKVQLWSYGS